MTITYRQARDYIDEYLSKPFPDSHWGPAHVIVEDDNLDRGFMENAIRMTNAAIFYHIAFDVGASSGAAIGFLRGLIPDEDIDFLIRMSFYAKSGDAYEQAMNLRTLVETKLVLEQLVEWCGDGDIEDDEEDEDEE